MSEFNPYNDELYHWAKGDTKTGAKYVARKWVNGKWQYVYSRLDQAKKKAPGELDKVKQKTKKGANDTYSFVKSNGSKAVKNVKSYANNVKSNSPIKVENVRSSSTVNNYSDYQSAKRSNAGNKLHNTYVKIKEKSPVKVENVRDGKYTTAPEGSSKKMNGMSKDEYIKELERRNRYNPFARGK